MLALLLVLTTACVVVSLIIVSLALLDRSASLPKAILIAALFSVSGLYIDALPTAIALPDSYELPLEFISLFSTGLIWWLALSVLDDDFRLGSIAWLGMIASVAGLLINWVFWLLGVELNPATTAFLITAWYGVSVIQILHVAWVALSGFKNDLLGARRIVRICLAVLPVLAIAANLIADFAIGDIQQRLLRVVIALPITLMVLFWLVRFEGAALNFRAAALLPSKAGQAIDPKDQKAHQRLLSIMKEEHAYLDPDLSISGLAHRVGVPAHQLRKIINQGMGFRNFYAFLSSYRLFAIKRALSDPEKARVPILTIALDGGFSSLATFNRAFKETEGQTPSAYRKTALEVHIQR